MHIIDPFPSDHSPSDHSPSDHSPSDHSPSGHSPSDPSPNGPSLKRPKHRLSTVAILLSCSIIALSTLAGWMNKPPVADPATIARSASKGLLLLEKSGYTFIIRNKVHCISCHHNTLTSMSAELAKQK